MRVLSTFRLSDAVTPQTSGPPQVELNAEWRAAKAYPVVAIATDSWQPERHQSGVVSYTTNIVRGMRELGATVHVLATNMPAAANDCVWPVPAWDEIRGYGWKRVEAGIGRRLWADDTQSWMMARRLLHVLQTLHKRQGVQVFETEESCGVARLVARHSPVPVVVRLHGPWFLVGPAAGADPDAGFDRRVLREGQCLMNAAGVSAPSRDVIRRTEEFYDRRLPFSTVIPNPVCSPLEAERWTYERCDPDGLLFVGRFDRAKGADILLEAFGRVLRVRPSARLIIVGADTGIADEYGRRVHAPEYIARLLPARWMAERIEVLGIRTPQEIIELRRRSCISVVASRYESFSMVTLEAMAAGAPVIAPNVGGISEIVEHEHNGLLFRPEDAANLAAIILQLMSNPAMARTLGQQAARDAVMNYSPAGIARHTLTFHQEVIERSRYKAQMR